MLSDENFGYCPCLCGICNEAYFVTEFLPVQAQALLGF
jgi:hypothetical protein